MSSDAEFEAWLAKLKIESDAARKSDYMNTIVAAAIGGGLGYLAYWTVAHAVLFAFVVFGISATGNRIIAEMRSQRVKTEGQRFIDRT